MRSTINTVWHLAITATGQDPPPDENRVAFPISDTPEDWEGRGQYVIQSLDQGPRAIIEESQPHLRLHAPDPEPLSLLAWLNNKDKHRVTTPIAVLPEDFGPLIKVAPDSKAQLIETITTGEALKDNAVLHILRFDRPTYVYVYLEQTFFISLDLKPIPNSAGYTYLRYDKALIDTGREVARLVNAL